MKRTASMFGVGMIVGGLIGWSVGTGASWDMTNMQSETQLNPNSLYTGSMTVAAVAVFGSTALVVVQKVTKPATLTHKLDGVLIVVGPYLFAATHVTFAVSLCCFDTRPFLMLVGLVSMLCLGMTAIGLAGFVKRQLTSPK